MDALIPKFVPALSATTFEGAAKARKMNDEGTAKLKANLGRAACVTNTGVQGVAIFP